MHRVKMIGEYIACDPRKKVWECHVNFQKDKDKYAYIYIYVCIYSPLSFVLFSSKEKCPHRVTCEMYKNVILYLEHELI